MTENLALLVNDFAFVFLDEFGLLEKAAVIFVGHETDFHRFVFVGGLQAGAAGHVARVGLREFAQRHDAAGELFLLQ